MPELLTDFCTYLGNLCMPISVLITGALIATQRPRDILTNKRLYLFNAIKLIALPLIICGIAKLVTLGLSNSYEIVMFCTVIAALPSAATITMLAELYDIDPGYASQTVGMTSVLATATLPVMMLFAQWVASL
jgi:predicted permease